MAASKLSNSDRRVLRKLEELVPRLQHADSAHHGAKVSESESTYKVKEINLK